MSGRIDTELGIPPVFDPIWGTLGAPGPHGADGWHARNEEGADGVPVDVVVLGDGFQISGQVQTGQFDRLSSWLNVQSGFIPLRNAVHVEPGRARTADPDQARGTLWVRVDQIVMVAERSAVQQPRPGAPIVRKERRQVVIVTPGYQLRGNIHVHAHGAMAQFLDSPDQRFLPVTDVTVRWLSGDGPVARFQIAMVNREQLVTVLDESGPPAGVSPGLP